MTQGNLLRAAARVFSILTFMMVCCSGPAYVQAQEQMAASVLTIRHFISVPLARQNADYTCGVTALQSIIGYYGMDKRLDELAAALHPDPEKGTNYAAIGTYAQTLGFDVKIRTGMTLAELKECIDQMQPVLLAIQAWADSRQEYLSGRNENGHYVVAIGYDDDNVYFMDPSTFGHYTYIPAAELVARWHDYDSYGKTVLNRLGMILTKPGAAGYDGNEIRRLD